MHFPISTNLDDSGSQRWSPDHRDGCALSNTPYNKYRPKEIFNNS